MEISLLNAVILAQDYNNLVEWYKKTFALDIGTSVNEEYHYTELRKSGKFVIAIGDAKEMGVTPSEPRNNTLIAQFTVSDITIAFEKIRESGGKILFGPSYDEKWKFHYGGFNDIEGNQIWIVQNS
jgi:predicted enzyme related to lactoylglutathione lyase